MPCGWGAAPYAGDGAYEAPVQETERLAGIEEALAEQLAEVRRMQARLEETQARLEKAQGRTVKPQAQTEETGDTK